MTHEYKIRYRPKALEPKKKTIFSFSKEIHDFLDSFYWEHTNSEKIAKWFYIMLKSFAEENSRAEKDTLYAAVKEYVDYMFVFKQTPRINKFQKKFEKLYLEHTVSLPAEALPQ